MRKLVPLLVASLFFCSYSNAQVVTNPTQTSPDLLDPSAQNWSGNYGTGYWGGSQNPPVGNPSIPNRLPSDTGFVWGGANEIIGTTIAINSALQVAGIQVNGFEYEWRVKNGNANLFAQQPGVDDFIIEVDIYDAQGNLYATYQYDYGYSHNWTTHSGQELFVDPFLPPSYFDRVEISAQGSDSANWAGRYGPEFNVDVSELKLIFQNNPCHTNPLYDPQCQGYATALFNQQCTQNPLFDPTCAGYAAAYLSQQCSANPLYDPACPGYANAYYNQQCDLDPLYDVTCPNYQQAYLEQQCDIDPLYDVTCIGYQDAIISEDIIDDIENTEIDVVTTTIIEGVPNFLSLPDLPPVQVIIEETIVEEEYDIVEGDALAMEDDIEKEIAELERAEEEPEEEEVVVITDDGSDEELPGNADGSMNNGEATQDDDIEKEIAELKKDAPKKTSRNEKIKMLLAQKAIELTKKVEESVSIEQQMLVQRQLLALISYVPGFDYAEKELNQVNFYPPKPVVDHAYARWFLNDPNFVEMEDLQYNFK